MAQIDVFSLAALQLRLFFRETRLALATGFIWRHDQQFFLITNWHNVTGKNPFTGKHLSDKLAEPDAVEILINRRGPVGRKFPSRHALRNSEGAPLWREHPTFGATVDAVALPLGEIVNAEMYPINEIPNHPLLVAIGGDVFVLGYPFSSADYNLPIWKRASIASEPQLPFSKSPYFLIDTASREGMSGSPVLMRSWGAHVFEGGGLTAGPGQANRLVGIYTGRLKGADELDAQLGLVWPTFLIREILLQRRLNENE